MTAIRIARPSAGPRLYLLGARTHHGLAGTVAAAVGVWRGWRTVTALGVAAALHDITDFPWLAD